MATWLDAITGPLGAATKTLQELMEARDLIKFGDTFRKMHGEIMAAQASALAGYQRELSLSEEIGVLKKQVAQFETWDTEKERYEMKGVGGRTIAYMLKKDARGVEPAHWICAHCYGNRHAEILQYIGIMPGFSGHRWICPACKTHYRPDVDPSWID